MEWIDIKEKLPPIKQHVLLSCYGRVIYGRMESEDGNSGYPIFKVCDSVNESKPIFLETSAHNEFTAERISAWMPLPAPYDKERNCNNCIHHSDSGCKAWECKFEKANADVVALLRQIDEEKYRLNAEGDFNYTMSEIAIFNLCKDIIKGEFHVKDRAEGNVLEE